MTALADDKQIEEADVWHCLAEVPDPEIPVLSVVDLGIVRSVVIEGNAVTVAVAPTYSGCPATEVIESSIKSALQRHGLSRVTIDRVLSPPWTTDWISDAGRGKLLEYGIAPPEKGAVKRTLTDGARAIACPQCASTDTSLVSEFGSTACKAAYRCHNCLEPFEYFKCI